MTQPTIGQLEHYNLTTSDYEGMKTFLLALFDNYRVRYEGVLDPDADQPIQYAHIGDESTYVAVQGTPGGQPFQPQPDHYFNHYCFSVDDIVTIKKRLKILGVAIDSEIDHPFRRRLYCRDFDGNRYEFVEYLVLGNAQKHSYEHD